MGDNAVPNNAVPNNTVPNNAVPIYIIYCDRTPLAPPHAENHDFSVHA